MIIAIKKKKIGSFFVHSTTYFYFKFVLRNYCYSFALFETKLKINMILWIFFYYS